MSAFTISPQVGGIGNVPRRAYITTSNFNTNLYTYTVNRDVLIGTEKNPERFITTGILTANVPGATASTCPAARILRENGKRLYPEANPSISTLMVGVYDAVSGLSGYIDPNAPLFAVYNTDKSYSMPDGVNPNGGLVDQGPPLYTRGSVTAGTTITAGGNISATTGAVSGRRLVILDPVVLTQSTTATLTADCSLGSMFTVGTTTSDNFTIDASNVTTGQMVTFIINLAGNAVTPTITFGNNIRENAALLSLLVTSGRQATVTFIGVANSYLLETSRVAANTPS